MRAERLGALGTAHDVLRAVEAGARRAGLPGPAALIGDWFGSAAVIAPSVAVVPVDPADVFAAPSGPGGDVIGGGWIGYLSYPDPGADDATGRIPDAAGGWTDSVLRLDRSGCWWYESLSGATLPDWLESALRQPATVGRCEIDWRPPDPLQHRNGVQACLEAIRAGEVYQACVCTQFTGTATGSALDFFADAVERTTPARAAFVAGDWGAVASLSPELFLRRAGTEVSSSPIKGTLPIHADPADLRASDKDIAENIMIVDLVRNDLGHVAVTGSVTVAELLAVHPAPGVWHLVSTVAAEVPTDLPMSALLNAAFPPASVTGTPKGRARELISGWERHRRGIYCGTVGMASPVAGCELNVAIRTVEFDAHGNAVLGVGGGITADSDPAAEWQECLDKAAAIVNRHAVSSSESSSPESLRSCPTDRARNTAS
ncbi:MAG TPA: aminodeoxychorismate synthase component I [Mycobacterium sp.]|nr:aminodeoxychorismate synthase component I [Mycobacterium sp.]HQC75989.1 aminodeoxychorismate synthase component I [Mycobacterium sp.]